MARGVFLHRTDSIYDDRPELQYQFPKQYLSRAAQFVGDWIIYYEPVRGPTAKGYFAIARVERIIPDPSASNMYLALIEPGSYLPFERPVPFSGGADGVVERGLLNEAGAAGSTAARPGRRGADPLRLGRRSRAGRLLQLPNRPRPSLPKDRARSL